MRRVLSVCVAAGLLTASAIVMAQGDVAKGLVGRWEGQRQAEGRVDNLAFVFRTTDKGLSGDCLLNGEVFGPLTDVVVDEKNKKVTFSAAGLDFAGVVNGKTLTLTANYQGRDLWTLATTRKDK